MLFFNIQMTNDHFSDFDENATSTPYNKNNGEKKTSSEEGKREYSQEIFSEKISTKYRTFFVDVKKNSNGYLIKISEKSRGGKKSTIMMDAEDLPDLIKALQNAQAQSNGE